MRARGPPLPGLPAASAAGAGSLALAARAWASPGQTSPRDPRPVARTAGGSPAVSGALAHPVG